MLHSLFFITLLFYYLSYCFFFRILFFRFDLLCPRIITDRCDCFQESGWPDSMTSVSTLRPFLAIIVRSYSCFVSPPRPARNSVTVPKRIDLSPWRKRRTRRSAEACPDNAAWLPLSLTFRSSSSPSHPTANVKQPQEDIVIISHFSRRFHKARP